MFRSPLILTSRFAVTITSSRDSTSNVLPLFMDNVLNVSNITGPSESKVNPSSKEFK